MRKALAGEPFSVTFFELIIWHFQLWLEALPEGASPAQNRGKRQQTVFLKDSRADGLNVVECYLTRQEFFYVLSIMTLDVELQRETIPP